MAIIGENGNLCYASLFCLFDNRNFRDRCTGNFRARQRRDRHGRHADQQQFIPVRSDRAYARFDDIIGIFPFVTQNATAGSQMLPQGFCQVFVVGRARDGLGIEKDTFVANRRKINAVDGRIDGVADEQLLCARARCVAPFGRATACHNTDANSQQQ